MKEETNGHEGLVLLGGLVIFVGMLVMVFSTIAVFIVYPVKYDMVPNGYQKRAIESELGSYDSNKIFHWNDEKLEKVMNPSPYVRYVGNVKVPRSEVEK